MKTLGIVVARMGSSRVPGKSLIPLEGRPVVEWVMDAVKRVRGLSEIVFATSTAEIDTPLADFAQSKGWALFRGHPDFVLDRVRHCALEHRADVVMHFGGDCPLLDAEHSNRALAQFLEGGIDYLNNYEPPTFPEGLDINVISFPALERAFREAVAPSQRINPYSYLSWHPELFRLRNYALPENLSMHHWSMDFPEDVEFLRLVLRKALFAGLGRAPGLQEMLDLLRKDPELAEEDHRLQRPLMTHAFWNSPGILRDMRADETHLSKLAAELESAGKPGESRRVKTELDLIRKRLHQAEEELRKAGP